MSWSLKWPESLLITNSNMAYYLKTDVSFCSKQVAFLLHPLLIPVAEGSWLTTLGLLAASPTPAHSPKRCCRNWEWKVGIICPYDNYPSQRQHWQAPRIWVKNSTPPFFKINFLTHTKKKNLKNPDFSTVKKNQSQDIISSLKKKKIQFPILLIHLVTKRDCKLLGLFLNKL